MKILLYDLVATQPNTSGDYHGGGKYGKIVFLELLNFNNNVEWQICGLYDSTKKLDDDLKKEINQRRITLFDLNNQNIKDIILNNKIDRFYSALPQKMRQVSDCPCEFYGTIHGLRSLETRMTYDALNYTNSLVLKSKYLLKIFLDKYLFQKEKKIIKSLIDKINYINTVSYHTKFGMISYYPQLDTQRIKVFYSPSTVANITKDILIDKEFGYNDYFLMVSGNRWIKNNLKAALALDELFTERPDLKKTVIITGVKDKSVYLNKIKNKDKFVLLSYVKESELSFLYKNAYAFIYMSLNEGFGYPPLEAMCHGIPVVASPLTSITEICGDAVLYANPYSLKEIKNRILQIYTESVYKTYSERGFNKYIMIKEKQDKDLKLMVDYLLSKN